MKILILACVLTLSASAFGQACVASSSQSCTPNVSLALPNANSLNWNVPLVQNFSQLDLIFGGSVTVPNFKISTLTFPETTAPAGAGNVDLFWGDSTDHLVHQNLNNGGDQHVPIAAFVTSTYTNATTGFTTVPLSATLTVGLNRNYRLECQITWQGSAGTTGPKFQITGPAAVTAVTVNSTSAITATTSFNGSAVAFSSPIANTGTITTATNFPATVTMGLVNGANTGALLLQAAANGAGTLTIQPGSFCILQ